MAHAVSTTLAADSSIDPQVLRWMRELGVAGNLSTDLQIAAIAHRDRATVYSNDTDFLRIPALSVCNPLLD